MVFKDLRFRRTPPLVRAPGVENGTAIAEIDFSDG
jgi:hypothetical protein